MISDKMASISRISNLTALLDFNTNSGPVELMDIAKDSRKYENSPKELQEVLKFIKNYPSERIDLDWRLNQLNLVGNWTFRFTRKDNSGSDSMWSKYLLNQASYDHNDLRIYATELGITPSQNRPSSEVFAPTSETLWLYLIKVLSPEFEINSEDNKLAELVKDLHKRIIDGSLIRREQEERDKNARLEWARMNNFRSRLKLK